MTNSYDNRANFINCLIYNVLIKYLTILSVKFFYFIVKKYMLLCNGCKHWA